MHIQKRVLIIDDNSSIRKDVTEYLTGKGYEVIEAEDGISGLDKALSTDIDLVILDVVMPGMDGFNVCRLIRESGKKTPVIMLTEKKSLEDKVEGFTIGADDYLGKPFSHLELELRIQSLLRRRIVEPVAGAKGILKHCDIEIDFEKHTVKLSGEEITLTPIEFGILRLLASNPGRVYSRQELLNCVWDTHYDGYKRNIDPHVTRLRNKIEDNPRRPKYVLTVWGVGYKFSEECPE